MSVGPFDMSFGLEEMARSLLIMMHDEIDGKLSDIEDEWADEDESLDEMREIEHSPVPLEPIKTYLLGHQPFLIEERTPVTVFPALATMAFRAGESPESDGDHFDEFENAVFVEVFVKASPTEGAEACDKRAWRTAEAIHRVVMQDPSLKGKCIELSEPSCVISEVFTREFNSAEGFGEEWFWQAARVEYGAKKISPR